MSQADPVEAKSSNHKSNDNSNHLSPANTGRRWWNCSFSLFSRLIDRYPRSFALFFGIIFPLFLLIAISWLFGFMLARAESPVEIETNDDLMRSVTLLNKTSNLLTNLTYAVPRICFRSFLYKNTDYDWDSSFREAFQNAEDIGSILEATISYVLQLENGEYLGEGIEDVTIEINVTEMDAYLSTCGNTFRNEVEEVLAFANNVSTTALSEGNCLSLTFKWNRCTPYNKNSTIHWSSRDPNYRESLWPVSTLSQCNTL